MGPLILSLICLEEEEEGGGGRRFVFLLDMF